MKRKAFTLIELLVVVAIIALLIAILLPSLAKARSAARTSACLANARSMGMTLQVYMSDWSTMIPYDTGATTGAWPLLLQGYGNIEKIRQCPETSPNPNPGQGSAILAWNNPAGNAVDVTGAYGLNGWLYHGVVVSTGTNYLLRYAITLNTPTSLTPDPSYFWNFPFTRNTATIPIVADSAWVEGWPLSDNPAPTVAQEQAGTGSSNSQQMHRFSIARHGKTINVAFVDGHAENEPLQQLWTLQWYQGWQNPNPLPTIP